jgi:hypothetical protein
MKQHLKLLKEKMLKSTIDKYERMHESLSISKINFDKKD